MPWFRSRQFNHNRPFTAFHIHPRMLQCGPSLRPFAHGAAFLLAETSVSGQSGPTLSKLDGWLLELSLLRDCDPSRLPLSHHQFS